MTCRPSRSQPSTMPCPAPASAPPAYSSSWSRSALLEVYWDSSASTFASSGSSAAMAEGSCARLGSDCPPTSSSKRLAPGRRSGRSHHGMMPMVPCEAAVPIPV